MTSNVSPPLPGAVCGSCVRPDLVRDDELLALLLATWVLHTGRIPPGCAPAELSGEQLIEFWADEQTASGDLPATWR